MFKKFLIALTLTTIFFTTATPKAHAGLAIGFAFGEPGTGAAIGAGAGVAYTGYVYLAQDGESMGETLAILCSPIFISIGALLDVDSSLSRNDLFKAFQQKYPFIDNQEAIANLSDLVKVRFSQISGSDTSATEAYITMSREEIVTALETADLSEAQLEKIVLDFK